MVTSSVELGIGPEEIAAAPAGNVEGGRHGAGVGGGKHVAEGLYITIEVGASVDGAGSVLEVQWANNDFH